jgi:hypothetical protein
VPDDRAMLHGRAGVGPPRPMALQGHSFDPARSRTGGSAEMPVVPRGVADRRDRYQFPGQSRCMGTRLYGAIVPSILGLSCLAQRLQTSVSLCSATALGSATG